MTDCKIVISGWTYAFVKDFYRFPGYMPDVVDLDEVVFVGYGLDVPNSRDYEGVDVRGKTVMIIMNDPMTTDGKNSLTGGKSGTEYKAKRALAQENGASAVLFVNSTYDTYISRIKIFLEQKRMVLDRKVAVETVDMLPTVFLSPSLADKMLKSAKKKSYSKQVKRIDRTGKPNSFSFNMKDGSIILDRKVTNVVSENVLAFIEGSDPVLKNEVVVVSSHYDHIGIANGEINNGADDDGSGTVCAMQIAAMLQKAKKEGHGPKRSVLVINFTGEEKGLLGSEWYSEYPLFPLDKTVCNLNIDMVGRHDAEHDSAANYIYIIGSDFLSTDLHNHTVKVREVYNGPEYDYRYNSPTEPNRFYYRSDHYNFAKNGVPSVFYFSGVHEDYHKPTDTAEKINYEKLEKVTELIFLTTWHAANGEKRFVVDK